METKFAFWAILMLECIGVLYAGNRINENIFYLNAKDRIKLGRQEKKQVEMILSRPAKTQQLLGSEIRLASSSHKITLSDMKSALILSAKKQRHLQFASISKDHKKSLLGALLSETRSASSARYRIKKLQRRDACTLAGNFRGINFADCNLNPETQTTTPKSKSGILKNPNRQAEVGRIGAPAVPAPPEVLTIPSTETRKTTRMLSSTPINVVLTTNYPLTGQSKRHMTILAQTTAPYASMLVSASKGYSQKINTSTTGIELTLSATSIVLSLSTIKGNNLLKRTTPETPSTKWYGSRTSTMELATFPSASLNTWPHYTKTTQGNTMSKMFKGPTKGLPLDSKASPSATTKKDIIKSITFATTLLTPSNAHETVTAITAINDNAKITSFLTGSRGKSEAHPAIITVNNNASILPPLTTFNVTPAIVTTQRTEKYSSGTNGGFFTGPSGIAVIAVILTSALLVSVFIYSFVSDAVCNAVEDKNTHGNTCTSDKENNKSDPSPNTSVETLSPSISSTSSGSDVLMTPVELPDLGLT